MTDSTATSPAAKTVLMLPVFSADEHCANAPDALLVFVDAELLNALDTANLLVGGEYSGGARCTGLTLDISSYVRPVYEYVLEADSHNWAPASQFKLHLTGNKSDVSVTADGANHFADPMGECIDAGIFNQHQLRKHLETGASAHSVVGSFIVPGGVNQKHMLRASLMAAAENVLAQELQATA